MKATAVVGCLFALVLVACDRSSTVAGSAEVAPGASANEPLDSLPPTAAGSLPATAEPPRAEVSPQEQSAYAAMEDRYLGDSTAQWAVSAKASTSFGESGEVAPGTYMESRAWKATGQVDGNTWSNDQKISGVTGWSWALPMPCALGRSGW